MRVSCTLPLLLPLLAACGAQPDSPRGARAVAGPSVAPSVAPSNDATDLRAPGPNASARQTARSAPQTASAGVPTEVEAPAWGAEMDLTPLEPRQASQEAMARGMKITLIATRPVRCPKIPPPAGDPARLEAQGALARTLIDIDGFMRADVGVAEAVALLGVPALCSVDAFPGYLQLNLAPRAPNVHDARIETQDGELIGLAVDLESPVPVDVLALARRFGAPEARPGPMDSFEAGSDVFQAVTPDFHASLAFGRRGHRDPMTRRMVHRLLFRRTASLEVLPDRFQTVKGVTRLAALALRPRAPNMLVFFGTLGVYDQTVGDRITFRALPAMRNVANASLEKRTRGDRDLIHAVHVEFARPIVSDGASLARALQAALGVPVAPPAPGASVELVAPGRGTVHATFARGGVSSVSIARVGTPDAASTVPH